jgi:hypothetical protein
VEEYIKRLDEKPNTIQEFTLQFFADSVSIDGTVLPLGQVSADVLNLSDDTLINLRDKNLAFAATVEKQLWNVSIRKDAALAAAVQDKINSAFDVISTLPLYRHLDLDKKLARNLLPLMLKKRPDEFIRLCDPKSMEASVFAGLIRTYLSVADEAVAFRTYISAMLDFYFERLKKRNSEHYAIGLYDFLRNVPLQQEIAKTLPPYPGFMFLQSRNAMIEYTTMPNPANEKEYMIAERMVFHSLGAFLHVDFFRGLMRSNAPRRCHNCGRFFLLTEGYDTRYCNNIAPGETKRTCRKVGAHRKEALRAEESLIQAEYRKVYSRLKTRKSRKKISDDEWNRQVALAQDYKEQAEKGKLSDFELRRLYEKM